MGLGFARILDDSVLAIGMQGRSSARLPWWFLGLSKAAENATIWQSRVGALPEQPRIWVEPAMPTASRTGWDHQLSAPEEVNVYQ